MSNPGPAFIALRFTSVLALAATLALTACDGGAEDPPARRQSNQVKNLIECAGLPDATIESVSGLPSGGTTSVAKVDVAISLATPLPGGCLVRVLRDGVPLPGALATCAPTCQFSETLAVDGTYTYAVRTEGGGTKDLAGPAQGALSSAHTVTLDRVAPTQSVTLAISDDINPTLGDGADTADPTPQVAGQLSAPLGAGEALRLKRNGTPVAALTPQGTAWSFVETNPLADGAYTYEVQVVDAAGLVSASVASRAIRIDAGAPPLQGVAATLAAVNGVAPASGEVPANRTTTPTLAGQLERALGSDEVVAVYRNGTRAGVAAAAAGSSTWTYTSPALADGTHQFRAQVERAGAPGTFGRSSATVSVPVDTTPPEPPLVRAFANNRPFQSNAKLPANFNASGQTTDEQEFETGAAVSDPDPRLRFEVRLAAGELWQLSRNGVETHRLTGPRNQVLSVSEPAAIARPPSVPSVLRATVTYVATRTDAAGNAAATTFSFRVGILPCDQGRAIAKYPLSAHWSWPPGPAQTAGCTPCHQTLDARVISGLATHRAEVNNLGESSEYWCTKQ